MTFLVHYGTAHDSGRYPWGSGERPYQSGNIRATIARMKDEGMTEKQIAQALGYRIKELRERIANEKTQERMGLVTRINALKLKGTSEAEIARLVGKPESTVRSLLNPITQERLKILEATSNMLKVQVDKKPYLDIGAGVEYDLGIKRTKFDAAVRNLLDSGEYKVSYVDIEQVGTGKFTKMKILTKKDVTYKELLENRDQIRTITDWTDDGGLTYMSLKPVKSLDSSRVMVRFNEDGGANMDGVIQIRRGVNDLSLGDKRYAQVRIAVDDKFYMKGMAVYADDLPPGVDIIYNSNKSKAVGKEGAFKKYETDDPTNPFATTIRQKTYIDENGVEQLSPLNRVGYSQKIAAGEEGYWATWNSGKVLSQQFLSKQRPELAQDQLNVARDLKLTQYENIMRLTNPVVKQKMLDSFADDCDSAAVHLEAAGLPRQSARVILPVNSLKDNEVYAPSYKNGEQVILVRYPHAGPFEIPLLTVNNRNREGIRMMGADDTDAIGITSKTAVKLSGADFDGDAVIVIPYQKRFKVEKSLKELETFDPKALYKYPEGIPHKKMTERETGIEMGKISNLITDASVQGATPEELTRMTKHSMVVIDARKHDLNYKQSFADNRIGELKEKFQGSATAGAATLLSRSSAEIRVDARRALKKGDPGFEDVVRRNEYSVNKKTGERVYAKVEPKTWVDKDGNVREYAMPKKVSSKMYETNDARTLISKKNTHMEQIYANYANEMKALANKARLESINTVPTKYSPSAKKTYANEVMSLDAKLNLAQKNAPAERQAQILANSIIKAKVSENPNLTGAQIKKIKGQALETARLRVGAKKQRIDITSSEWEAIQAGAISYNKLNSILANTKLENVQKLATPRATRAIPDNIVRRAKGMLANGYTLSEISEMLGISTSTVSSLR